MMFNAFSFCSGLKPDMPFDRLYTLEPSQLMTKDFTFHGYQNSKIIHDAENRNWKFEILSDPEIYALTNGSIPPLGTKEYLLSDNLGGGTVVLNLNSCDNDKEYNCKDGSCISIEKRCDSKFDCSDSSDEDECKLIITPASYLKYVPGAYSTFQVFTLF